MIYSSLFPLHDPTWIFFGVLCIILFAPLLFNKLRLPHIIGMILAGLLVGPNGLHIFDRDSSFEIFSEVGLYYIMFLAALEINLQDLKRAKGGVAMIGILAFVVPVALGLFTNIVLLDFSVVAGVLLASMYASYTLISYPIVARYGLSRLRCVNFVVGGAIVTDTLTLFVLAIVSGLFSGEADGWFLLMLVLKMIFIAVLIVFTFPRIARFFFRRYNDGIIQYIFVMAMLFMGAGLMKLAGMEGILGAFITGLVLNRQIPHSSPLMRHIDFVGNAIFIPYFLIGVGMIINLKIFADGGLSAMVVPVAMVITALTGKWLASWFTAKAFKLSSNEHRLMFGLSSSQAAATLAAALVGHSIILPDGSPLLPDDVLNGTILLILVSCVVSSITVDRTSRKITVEGDVNEKPQEAPNRTLLALANPAMVNSLMELALMMRKKGEKEPLSAVNVVLDEDEKMMERGRKVLDMATKISASVNVPLLTKVRLTTNLSNGIIHEMKESDYRELIIGFHQKETAHDTFLGGILPELLDGLQGQIVVARLFMPLNTVRCIHITFPAKAEFEAGFYQWVGETSRMGYAMGCRVRYHGHPETMKHIEQYIKQSGDSVRAEYEPTDGGNDLKRLAPQIKDDHLLVIVSARRGSISFRPSLDHVFVQLQRDYQDTSILLIYPGGHTLDNETI